MPSTNSIHSTKLSVAKQQLWEKAVIKSHGERYGTTPDKLGFDKEHLSHIDIGAEPGKLMVKAFYTGSKHCFYYNIPEAHIDHWFQAMMELYRENPFKAFEEEDDTDSKKMSGW